ncbi:MAG: MBL fold metallo-hydrolase [Gemmatimonadales bacterium]|nr:MBL fold metallo-hydrolase [Gemmatimonadales bacterium]
MLLQRLHDPKLSQTSYLIGCATAGEAIVIDPTRDAEQYLAAAAALGLCVRHVTETHIHADFVSGSRELATRAGAALYLSDEGGEDWRYDYAPAAGAVLLREGDGISVGTVRLRVIHTPGHTPEHLTFLVTDGAAATEPIAAVTGDFVFVGDVGRPDLLERVARQQGTMAAAARALFRSLQRFKSLPDWLQIWPGHGAGSACGKGLSAIPHSTLGYERRFNWAFGVSDEDEFVRLVLAGQPEPPRYFGTMKRLNKEGPRLVHALSHPARIAPERLPGLLAVGAFVIDARPAADYAAGHVPGTLNIPLNGSFTTWAGWLAPYDRDLYLLTADGGRVAEAVRDLALIGLDRVVGVFGPEVLSAWTAAGCTLATIRRMDVAELARGLGEGSITVIDVRGRAEWEAGHIPGVANIPLGELAERLDQLGEGRPLAVHCQGGSRSAIAASLLQANGKGNVVNVTGGFAEWERAGLPAAKEA